VSAVCQVDSSEFLIPNNFKKNIDMAEPDEAPKYTNSEYSIIKQVEDIINRQRYIDEIWLFMPASNLKAWFDKLRLTSTISGLLGGKKRKIGLANGGWLVSDDKEYVAISHECMMEVGDWQHNAFEYIQKKFDTWGSGIFISGEESDIIKMLSNTEYNLVGFEGKIFIVIKQSGLVTRSELDRIINKNNTTSTEPEAVTSDIIEEGIPYIRAAPIQYNNRETKKNKVIRPINIILVGIVVMAAIIISCTIGSILIRSCANKNKSPVITAPSTAGAKKHLRVLVNWGLPLREEPDPNSKIIRELKEGEELEVIGEEGEWRKVKSGDTVGYLRVSYGGEKYAEE